MLSTHPICAKFLVLVRFFLCLIKTFSFHIHCLFNPLPKIKLFFCYFLSGVLLYSILVEPRLQKTKICLVLTKMDYAYRQMRNEALLMLQIETFKKQITQDITIIEASAITKEGLDQITEWLFNWVFFSSTKQNKIVKKSYFFLPSNFSAHCVDFPFVLCMGEQKWW